LNSYDPGSEILAINFNVHEKEYTLRFRRNPQGRYELFSTDIATTITPLRSRNPQERLPYLCINVQNAEPNERTEVLAVPDTTPRNNQGSNANVRQPPQTGTPSSRQSYQTNISNSTVRRPSRRIIETYSVRDRDIITYVRRRNPSVDREMLNRLIQTYISEAGYEGVNIYIAIAQMLYATNFLTNQQRVRSNNYAALSATSNWNGSFPDMRGMTGMTRGVRAHIQHLKGYASRERLQRPPVDPRYDILRDLGYLGTVTTFDDLYTVWTQNSEYYGYRIDEILNDLYRYSE